MEWHMQGDFRLIKQIPTKNKEARRYALKITKGLEKLQQRPQMNGDGKVNKPKRPRIRILTFVLDEGSLEFRSVTSLNYKNLAKCVTPSFRFKYSGPFALESTLE